MRVALVIARQTAISADPCQRPLDDPTLRQHREFVQLRALDNYNNPAADAGRRQSRARSLITSIGKDLENERPQGARSLVKHQGRAVAVLNVGGMNCDAQQQAERIDEDMPLAARDLLARIITLRVKRSPPFCAALALWLSMIATVGLASRPSCSRTAT